MNSLSFIFVAVFFLYRLYWVFHFFLSRVFYSLLCEPNLFGEVFCEPPPVKGKQLYTSFPQLKSAALTPAPPGSSVLGHDVPSSSLKVVRRCILLLK